MSNNPILIDKIGVGERIDQLIKEFKIKNGRQFALSIQMDTSYFNKVYNGESTISEKYVDSICEVYKVSKEWLLYGIGDFKADKTAIEQIIKKKKVRGTDVETMANDILNLKSKVAVLLDEVAFLKSAPPKYPKEYWIQDLNQKSKELFDKLAENK